MIAVGSWLLVILLALENASAVPQKRKDKETEKKGAIVLGDTAVMIRDQGYPVEIHQVTTPDGYILTLHRIPRGIDQPQQAGKPVVFLLHGLTSASHAYVVLGRNLSIAYNLADAGFDVWMGNARGNAFSRAHKTLNPNDEIQKLQFYDFTWDDIGTIDLPTMIDYVLKVTGRKNLQYIGHSQGGTAFLVMNSVRPEYNAKILAAHLLAGVGYMQYFPNPILRTISRRTDFLFGVANKTGLVELTPNRPLDPMNPTSSQCFADPVLENACKVLANNPIITIPGQSKAMLSNDLKARFAAIGGSAGAGVKQFAHYGQNINARSFKRWNYGTAGNLKAYGTEQPPAYDLSRITVNTTMHYTVGDELLSEKDVLNMAKVMPNCAVRKVARATFTHGDFVAARDAKKLVSDYIVQRMLEAANRYEFSATADSNNSASSVTVSFAIVYFVAVLFV